MAVQFILGRSGTGKTTHCLGAIVEALLEDSTPPLILLVPEQATYQAERAILSDPRITGYHRLQILSFNRLQFFLAGRDATAPRISNLGRQMMVHKILRDSREQLQVFRSSALLPGFAREIAGTITELHRYAQTPDALETLEAQLQTQKGDRLTALKFADLSRIFRLYTDALGDRFVDADAQTGQACRAVAGAAFLRGARLWVDGFAGFTGAELALLLELLKAVDEAQIALCVDPDAVAEPALSEGATVTDGLFEPTEGTYRELLGQIHDAKIEILPPIALQQVKRFPEAGPLAHLERHLFRPTASAASAGETIRLVAAPSLRSEVQFVAGQIRRLVREKGHRYRDIAVVASDLSQYEHYVRAYFDDYGIPFFIDQRRPLHQHPVVELIAATLQTVTGAFAHADLFAYLKTDLLPIEPADVDVLENYCLAFGVDGRDWLGPDAWRFKDAGDTEFDERAINRIRTRVAQPLLELRQALCPGGDVEATLSAGEFTRAVFDFLQRLRIRQVVSDWVEQAHQAGDPAAADVHRQLFDRLVDIFDELVTVFENEAMTARDYLSILNLAFSQMTLAFIPPRLDQVLVGSIERSRHPNLKAVFLLGATQKQFPIPVPSSGVLTDADREVAEGAGFHLAPATTQSLAERQYLAYIAFTRPSEFLCISYPAVDEKGGPLVRSHFVDELASLFEDLTEKSVADSACDIANVHTQAELAELLCSRLGRDAFAEEGETGRLQGLLQAMQADGDWAQTAASVMAALNYDNRAVLERRVVDQLFGKELKSSATRLATFAACPYKYFGRYALELNPRQEFKLEPLDVGNFYHAVLDALHKRLASEGQNFATVDNERLMELTRAQIEAHASQNAFMAKFRSRSDHNAFIIANAGDILEECVIEIAQMARAGAFRPVRSEVGFGQAKDAQESLGPLEVALPNGAVLTLSGKIDRLDVADIEGEKIALVFDYKRSPAATTFSWSHFYHGLNIQLPMYLLALAETTETPVDRVAGAFCMPIEQAPGSALLEDLPGRADRFARKAKGLCDGQYAPQLDSDAGSQWNTFYNFCVTKNDDQYGRYGMSGALRPDDFQRLLAFTRAKIMAVASDILGGRIAVHPYRLGTQVACASCDYKAVCRFDWQINDYHFLEPKGKLDVVAASGKSE